jgi:hypothetical protein
MFDISLVTSARVELFITLSTENQSNEQIKIKYLDCPSRIFFLHIQFLWNANIKI